MLDDESVALVKAVFHRPTQLGGGGRTTELVARPLFSLYYPELTGLHQPLTGEYAGRRSVLEQLPFVQGWGVEVAMLIDIARHHGPEAIAQIDLGVREHRHRGLHALSVQAAEVLATMLGRVPAGTLLPEPAPTLHRPAPRLTCRHPGPPRPARPTPSSVSQHRRCVVLCGDTERGLRGSGGSAEPARSAGPARSGEGREFLGQALHADRPGRAELLGEVGHPQFFQLPAELDNFWGDLVAVQAA
jgi:glucosyl-3-phosphoglycerate synthase